MIIQDVPADPLSDVLSLSGLSATCSVRLSAGGVWALRFRPIALKFNVVQHGGCWLLAEGMPPAVLAAGDCFVVTGAPFVLASEPGVDAVDAAVVFADSPTAAQYGEGDDVALLGGSVSLEGPAAADLLALLPQAIVIRARSREASPIGWLLEALDREWKAGQAGSHVVCNDLLRLMFVHALREHIQSADAAVLGWLGGLKDPPIAAALRTIHAAPEQSWTLPALAQVAGMSRSAFALRFKQAVGQAPVAYAARWRMRVAALRLKSTANSVSQIAAALGFLSDAAFGAAFRRVHGVSPGQYRRN